MYDVIVFQRNLIVPEVWSAMDYWRAIGRTVVADWDDHYPDLPPSNPAHEYWIRNRAEMKITPIEALAEGLSHADAYTSPSKVLIKDWEHIVPGYWIPNYTRRTWYENLQQKPIGGNDFQFEYRAQSKSEPPEFFGVSRPESAGERILGWGGSISHVDSWIYSGIVPALDLLFEKWPNLRLKFCGHEGRLDYIFQRWGERVIKQLGVKPEHWPQVVSTFDIGLAPLDTRPLDPPWRPGAPVASYDERRSWLKGIEYLSAGIPWIGSDSLTYTDLRRWGTLVKNTPEDWFAAIDKKLTYLEAEKKLAWERRRWALKHVTMEANVNSVADVYGRIIADKSTRIGARLPGITYIERKKETA